VMGVADGRGLSGTRVVVPVRGNRDSEGGTER